MALELAQHFFASLPQLRFHPTAKRIRAFADGDVVVDSTRAWIAWEPRRVVPSHAVPLDDIHGSLRESQATSADEVAVQLGDGPPVLDPRTGFSFHTTAGHEFDVTVGRSTLSAAVFVPSDPHFEGRAIVDFESFNEWREEDELLVGHARDPFTYWSANLGSAVMTDVAWSYEHPHNYATAVKDMLTFFNERVDIILDGQPLERPRTPWS